LNQDDVVDLSLIDGKVQAQVLKEKKWN
jgi:hypothetical protein